MTSATKEKNSGTKAERGVQHPSETLEGTLELLARVREAIGFGTASRETIAEALGYSGITGTSARKLGSLTHYDLLERVSNGAYRISELGKRILMPADEAERQESIVEAAKRPVLFAQLVERYKGHALPAMLPHLLAREHGVFAGASESAAKTFRASMEFAGLLRHGVLYEELDASGPASSSTNAGPSSPHAGSMTSDGNLSASPHSAHQSAQVQLGSVQTYNIALDKSGRLAVLQVPLPVNTRDLRRVSAWIEYMINNVLDEEETPDTSSN